jgi:hypothetical protein
MSETRILIRLLQMYIPQNWEFGPAFSKLRNFGGGGLNPPNHPRGYASASEHTGRQDVVREPVHSNGSELLSRKLLDPRLNTNKFVDVL